MTHTDSDKEGFLFTVELLIEDRAAGLALEKLIRLLNTEHIQDYRILKGMDIGKIIYETVKQNSNSGSVKPSDLPELNNGKLVQVQQVQMQPKQRQPISMQPAQAKKTAANSKNSKEFMKQLDQLKVKGTLIRISINQGKGVKLNMPCRVLNIDADTENISLYNVDEKQVYLITLNEIENFTVS